MMGTFTMSLALLEVFTEEPHLTCMHHDLEIGMIGSIYRQEASGTEREGRCHIAAFDSRYLTAKFMLLSCATHCASIVLSLPVVSNSLQPRGL